MFDIPAGDQNKLNIHKAKFKRILQTKKKSNVHSSNFSQETMVHLN